jgi:hypothetical protein
MENKIHPQTWVGLAIKPYTPNLEYILYNVCSILNLSVEKVISRKKTSELVRARKIYSYLSVRKGFTCRETGETIGRDHATVVHSVKCINQRNYDWKLKADYEKVVEKMHLSMKENQEYEQLFISELQDLDQDQDQEVINLL